MKELREYLDDLLTEQDVWGDYDISSESKEEILHKIDKFEKRLLNIISDIVNTNNIEEEEEEEEEDF